MRAISLFIFLWMKQIQPSNTTRRRRSPLSFISQFSNILFHLLQSTSFSCSSLAVQAWQRCICITSHPICFYSSRTALCSRIILLQFLIQSLVPSVFPEGNRQMICYHSQINVSFFNSPFKQSYLDKVSSFEEKSGRRRGFLLWYASKFASLKKSPNRNALIRMWLLQSCDCFYSSTEQSSNSLEDC